jgi:hypothetical protein
VTEVRPIPGFPGYGASSDGRIVGKRGQWLLPALTGDGYLAVNLHTGRGMRRRMVHRLIASSWLPKPLTPAHDHVAHWDGDPTNNAIANLRWATRAENEADKKRHGRDNRGERHGRAKLTEPQVREIRQSWAAGVSQPQIASRYGVDRSTVSLIVTRRTWKHITDEGLSL